MDLPISERLGRYVVSLSGQSLSPAVREKAACCLLDSLSLAAAAADEPTTMAALSATARRKRADEGCRVWADGSVSSLPEAVMTNALAAHARFQDDCDMASWSHPGSLIVPAVVGAGEHVGATVDRVLRGIVAGYTVNNWIGGHGEVGHAMVERGFRTSPTIGPVGAAAGVALVLGLSAEQAAHAVAIVAGIAGGIVDTVRSGSADFRMQNAHAAWAGLNSALLAGGGVHGSPGIFESPQGYLACYAGSTALPPGEPVSEAILDTWSKPYPTLGDNVAVVAAALALHDRHNVRPADITSILVRQNAQFASYPGTAFRGPYLRPTQAIASTAYGVASTLSYGRLRYDRYLGELADPVVESLIGCLRVIPEPAYGFLDGMVEIELASGGRISQRASDLPRELFHRNERTAREALAILLAEKNADPAKADLIADEVFAAASDEVAARTSIGPVVAHVLDRFSSV